jgi:hypothetical protein
MWEYHGVHVADPREGCVGVDWSEPTPRTTRVRVREITCECSSVIYEVCQAAGLMFIRRTVRAGRSVVVHESEWSLTAEVERLWSLLLAGRAR